MDTEITSQLSTSPFGARRYQTVSTRVDKAVSTIEVNGKSNEETNAETSSENALRGGTKHQSLSVFRTVSRIEQGSTEKNSNSTSLLSEQESLTRSQSQSLEKQLEIMDEKLQSLRSELKFSTDDASGRTIVKVVNMDTNEVVRQIPGKDFLAMSHALERAATNMKGALFNEAV